MLALRDECRRLTDAQTARLVSIRTETIQDLYNGTIGLYFPTYVKINTALKRRQKYRYPSPTTPTIPYHGKLSPPHLQEATTPNRLILLYYVHTWH